MSDRGWVLLLLLWLAGALIAAVALMVVMLIRQPPAPDGWWRGVRRYFALACLICTPLPLLLLLGKVALFAYDTAGHLWWVPLIVAPVAVGGWLLWRWEREPKFAPGGPVTRAEHLPITEHPQAPAEPRQMWSMPVDARQWDTDSLPR